jgi:hypothetical protein
MESETVQMFIIGFLVTITVVGTAFFLLCLLCSIRKMQ